MGIDLGTIIYMVVGIYLVAGLLLGIAALGLGTWIVRKHAQHAAARVTDRSGRDYPAMAPRAGMLHHHGHA